METLNQISQNLQIGDDTMVAELTTRALDQQISPQEILDNGLIAGMNIIGDRFKAYEIFLPDVLLAAKAMYAGMDILKPLLIKEGIPSRGKIVFGSVQGDLHDIGKNLVGIMLKGAGYEVIDLGVDVSTEKFIMAIKDNPGCIVAMSALLTTTIPNMEESVKECKDKYPDIKIIVGGAPLTQEFAENIGADAYGYDAGHAEECIKAMIGSN